MTPASRCCNCDRVKVWVMACTLISNAAYATIPPFLPNELERKGISTAWVGPIFAVYSFGVIVISPCVSNHIAPRLGNANAIALGMAGMGISLGCFGAIMFGNNINAIIGSTFVTRFLQGASSAFIQTTCYIIATDDYPDNKEQIVGLVEAMTGVGFLLGPIISSALYAALKFSGTFFLVGAFILGAAFGIKYGFPKTTTIDHHESSDEEEGTDDPNSDASCSCTSKSDEEAATGSTTGVDTTTSEDQVSYWKLIKQARFALALVSAGLSYFMYCFLEPILSLRLLDFELSVPQIGLFFALFSLFYIPTSICIQWIPDSIEKRVTISMSLLISSIAFLLVGPSQILHFPNSLLMIGIGWSLLGVSLAALLVPILPEMVESSLPFFPGQEKRVNTICSGQFNSFLGIGQIISPLYGSAVYNWLGFRLTTDIASIIGLTFLTIYFVFANVRQAFRNSFNL